MKLKELINKKFKSKCRVSAFSLVKQCIKNCKLTINVSFNNNMDLAILEKLKADMLVGYLLLNGRRINKEQKKYKLGLCKH